jgi:hypothetical protein
MFRRISCTATALAALTACERPAPTGLSDEPSLSSAHSREARHSADRSVMDRLARRMARALADPEFRAHIKAELDRSPFVEHKLQLQTLMQASDGKVLRSLARLSAESESAVGADARESIPLEMYLPVPAHRSGWTGGPDILVASAREDREVPVAYDTKGRRQLLSPDRPPVTPVLAIVPVETDFRLGNTTSHPLALPPPNPPPPPPGPPPSPPPGLYMTYARFVQDFEGWFKGDPEYEIHVLGQLGTSDSLTDYQCAGNATGGYYRFDQNSLSWSGRVLLFSQAQLNNYRAAHPDQNFRIIALEDDDTGCVIKFDGNRFRNLQAVLQAAYPNLTGSKDTTTSTLAKLVKRANALQKILRAAYSFITTQDDLIGNAIEDVVVGQSYPGANWILKGENNVTNGWINLEMR